jgi:hypothetical protein
MSPAQLKFVMALEELPGYIDGDTYRLCNDKAPKALSRRLGSVQSPVISPISSSVTLRSAAVVVRRRKSASSWSSASW